MAEEPIDYRELMKITALQQGLTGLGQAFSGIGAIQRGERPGPIQQPNPYIMMQLQQADQAQQRQQQARGIVGGIPGMDPTQQQIAQLYPEEMAQSYMSATMAPGKQEEFGTTPVLDASGRLVQLGKYGTVRQTGVQGYRDDKDKIPVGYRRGASGTLELDPGYLRGQAAIAEATRDPKEPNRQDTTIDPVSGLIYGKEFDANGNVRLVGPLNPKSEPKVGSEEAGKARDAIANVDQLLPALDRMDELVRNTTRLGRSGLVPGGEESYGELRAMHGNFTQLINKIDLNGVLNEGDIENIVKRLPDPTSWRGGDVGETAFLAATRQLREFIAEKRRAAQERISRPGSPPPPGSSKDPWED